MRIPTSCSAPDHPLYRTSAVVLACMLKHSSLLSLAMSYTRSLAMDVDVPTMPEALCNVIRCVHQVKEALIQVRQWCADLLTPLLGTSKGSGIAGPASHVLFTGIYFFITV